MEFNHSCFNREGELYFRISDDSSKINIFRCCYLHAFKSISFEDVKNVDYLKIFEESKNEPIIIGESVLDRCSNCMLNNELLSKVSISITKACNLNCHNCFFTEHKDDLRMKESYFTLLEKTKGLRLNLLKFTDTGEPFFYFKETTAFLASLSSEKDTKSILFITNNTLLSKDRIKLLKSISNITGIQYEFHISFDGTSKESFETVRKGGSFEKIVENTKLLVSAFGQNQIRILYTLKKGNFTNSRDEIYDFFVSLGVLRDHVSICYDFMDPDAKNLFYNPNF